MFGRPTSQGNRSTPRKVPRPVLDLGDPVVDSSLVFAACPGWRRGWVDPGDLGDHDERTRTKGVWTLGAGGGQYGAGPQVEAPAGWGIDNGDGVTGDSSQQWNPSPLSRYDLPATQFTLAVSIRPDVVQASTTIPFFKRRAQPYGGGQAGWHFSAGAGNVWRFSWSNGVTSVGMSFATVQDANTYRTDFLVVTGEPSGANLMCTGYVNGVRDPQATNAALLVNSAAEPIKLLGLGPANERFPGFVDVAYAWTRTLTTPEIERLSADRFRPWRGAHRGRQGMAW